MHVAYYDLETTNFPTTSEILQIAVEAENGEEFNQYMFPITTRYISRSANVVHGISVVDNELHKNGEPLPDVVLPEEGLEAFIEFLEGLRENEEETILLCAHNGLRFDEKALKHNLMTNGLTLPRNVEFEDSLEILKDYQDKIGKLHLLDFSQQFLYFYKAPIYRPKYGRMESG